VRNRDQLVLLLLLALSACASVPRGVPAHVSLASRVVRVPLELINSMPILRVRVDGGAAIAAVFDTGAGPFVITPRRASEARLPSHVEPIVITSVDGKKDRQLPIARIARLDLEGVVAEKLEVLVAEELEEFGQALGAPIDAIVGAGLLRSKLVSIDYGASALVIEGGALPAPDGVEVLAADFSSLVPRVTISIAGKQVDVIIDSGCSNWLDLPMELEANLPLKSPSVPGTKHIGLNGEGRDRYARLAGKVQIGRHVLVDPPVHFGLGRARVCAQLLRYFTITLDARHARVRFHTDGVQPIAVSAERSAGLGVLKKQGAWVVADLMPGFSLPDLALGDVILSVNDQAAETLTRTDWERLKRSPVLHVELRRGDRRFEVDLPVRDIGEAPPRN
jgi:Aspartyl protease